MLFGLGCDESIRLSLVRAGSQLPAKLELLLALSLALLAGSVWRSHDRHYKQEYGIRVPFLELELELELVLSCLLALYTAVISYEILFPFGLWALGL